MCSFFFLLIRITLRITFQFLFLYDHFHVIVSHLTFFQFFFFIGPLFCLFIFSQIFFTIYFARTFFYFRTAAALLIFPQTFDSFICFFTDIDSVFVSLGPLSFFFFFSQTFIFSHTTFLFHFFLKVYLATQNRTSYLIKISYLNGISVFIALGLLYLLVMVDLTSLSKSLVNCWGIIFQLNDHFKLS